MFNSFLIKKSLVLMTKKKTHMSTNHNKINTNDKLKVIKKKKKKSLDKQKNTTNT
jgi:hypothetical protein